MKDSRTILKESGLTVKDMMMDNAEEKIIKYGWLCQVEIVNELACDDEEKFNILKKISIKGTPTE